MIEVQRNFQNNGRIPELVQNHWGRLIACLPQLDSVDLIEPSLKLGRSEECDIVIHKSKFLPDQLILVSKEQFIITKDSEDIYISYITDLSKNGTYLNHELIGRNKTVVLQNNDIIAVASMLKVYIFKSMMYAVDDNYLPPVLRKKYEVSRVLGKGACGEVRLVYEKLSCRKYAIKKIIKARNTPSQMQNINHPNRIYTEIEILQRLSHPLVVNMKEIIETDDEVFVILEYVKGGELTGRISSLNHLSESNTKFLFYQIVLAVKYLHSEGVTHRDLKPGNVLLSSESPQTLIKVTDFGLSKLSTDYDMKTICGTPHYMAPEVLNPTSRYDKQADVWSLGVILFHMLSKELPFQDRNNSLPLKSRILAGGYRFRSHYWYEISPAAIDLIKKMLVVNPKKRITIDEVLNHSWISKDNLMKFRVEKMINTSQESEQTEENG